MDFYDTVDLRVGFRVHAHVSALARRKYSYLIEQDGRGCDYGRYMNANISVPYYVNKTNIVLSKIFRAKTLSRLSKRGTSSAITQLLSVIGKDQRTGFETFSGLENQIAQINAENIAFLKKTCLCSHRQYFLHHFSDLHDGRRRSGLLRLLGGFLRLNRDRRAPPGWSQSVAGHP